MKNNKKRCLILIAAILCLNLGLNAQSSLPGLQAKSKIGIKAGANFMNVKDAVSINGQNKTGFMAGVFFSPTAKGILGYRSEVIFSRQGYDFKTMSAAGSVKLDYILLPQVSTINITKYVQLQIGGQVGFLLNAGADSTSSSSGTPLGPKPNDLFNRFTYGAFGGVELYPHQKVFIGGRFNLNLPPINKEYTSGVEPPNYFPRDVNQLYNNVFQLYAGFRF